MAAATRFGRSLATWRNLDELHPLEDPQDIVAVLARAIRAVADRDTTVGKSLLAVCLPRVAIERSENSMMIVLGPLNRTARGSVYLPSDSTEVIQYAPNFVCGIGLIRGSGGPRMLREYRGHEYEIRKLGEEQYRFQIWLPGSPVSLPGHSFGSPRTEEEADRMAREWIDQHGRHDRA
jgi:hypothetical protein